MNREDLLPFLEGKWEGQGGQDLNPLVYAYIGDAVFELMVRAYLVKQKPRKINQLHKAAVQLVNAKQQKEFLERLAPLLNDMEKDIIRRGRNTKPRHIPANTSGEEYGASTALETLFGHLYLHGETSRLYELLIYLLEDYFRKKNEI